MTQPTLPADWLKGHPNPAPVLALLMSCLALLPPLVTKLRAYDIGPVHCWVSKLAAPGASLCFSKWLGISEAAKYADAPPQKSITGFEVNLPFRLL